MRHRLIARSAALAAFILSVLARPETALASAVHTQHTQIVVSGAGMKWSTPSEHGRAVEVEPHPAWPTIEGAAWIWRTPTQRNEVVTFEKPFYIPHSVRNLRGALHITTDNAYQAFLNGQPVGANGPFDFDGPDEATWATIFDHAITPRKGWNVLTVRAINYLGPAEPPDNPAGLIFRLEANYQCPGRSCSQS